MIDIHYVLAILEGVCWCTGSMMLGRAFNSKSQKLRALYIAAFMIIALTTILHISFYKDHPTQYFLFSLLASVAIVCVIRIRRVIKMNKYARMLEGMTTVFNNVMKENLIVIADHFLPDTWEEPTKRAFVLGFEDRANATLPDSWGKMEREAWENGAPNMEIEELRDFPIEWDEEQINAWKKGFYRDYSILVDAYTSDKGTLKLSSRERKLFEMLREGNVFSKEY